MLGGKKLVLLISQMMSLSCWYTDTLEWLNKPRYKFCDYINKKTHIEREPKLMSLVTPAHLLRQLKMSAVENVYLMFGYLKKKKNRSSPLLLLWIDSFLNVNCEIIQDVCLFFFEIRRCERFWWSYPIIFMRHATTFTDNNVYFLFFHFWIITLSPWP